MKSNYLGSCRVAWVVAASVALGVTTGCVDTEGSSAKGGAGGLSTNGGAAATNGGAAATNGGAAATNGGAAATNGGAAATNGGASSAGGTTAVTGTTADMRDVTSMALVKELRLGWNLGNTLDANPDETGWGNPKTTQAMIDAVKAAGFNTVRIPTTWMHHMGAAPEYVIDEAWMDRVEEVTKYVLSAGMYAILNTHHDEWVSVMPTADQATISTRLAKVWTQIATRFKGYDEHLLFETLNEPRTTDSTQWTGGTAAARKIINAYNLAAVNAIRATGGNNGLRHIMIPTHAANGSNDCINDLVVPNNDAKIIVSIHTYYPYEFSFGEGATTWGTNAERTAMATELDRIAALLPKKGRAAVIGEWGTVNQNSNTAARADHAKTYAELVTARGMAAIWWDNGGMGSGSDNFGLLNRKVSPPTWAYPTIVTGLASGATAGAAAAP